jgi:hypothetical protein
VRKGVNVVVHAKAIGVAGRIGVVKALGGPLPILDDPTRRMIALANHNSDIARAVHLGDEVVPVIALEVVEDDEPALEQTRNVDPET